MKYRADIDGLRAVAILPVIFYHAGFPGPSGGFIGVDVFFVISGYLITSIVAGEIANGRFSLVSFYERRARRILPALTAVILATIAVGWFVLLPTEMTGLGQSIVATAFFMSNVYFTVTLDYFAPAAEFVPLLHTWSLAVEEQFYLFFPPLLMLLAARQWWRPLWIVAGLSLLSFAVAVVALPLKPDWVFYLIFFRAWELGAGAMLALTSLQPPKGRLAKELLAAAGILAILIPVFTYDTSTPFPAAAALPPVLGTTILIWIGARSGGSMVNTMLGYRAMVWIGLISYSLYLWHWPILAFLRIVLETAILPIEAAVAALVASVLMAWLSFRFVERPFRTNATKAMSQRAILTVSAISLVAMSTVGSMMYLSKGLPGRLPSDVTTLAAFVDDRNPRSADCFGVSPSEGLCAIGAPPQEDDYVDFLFWGDSHANAMMPGVDIAAGVSGQSGVFAALLACPPILNVQRISAGQACTDFNESMWSWLEARTDIPMVILGARWTLSVEGTRYKGEAGGPLRLEWYGDDDAKPSNDGNSALIEAGLEATVAKILSTGRKVIILGPIPEVGHNVPTAAARKALFGWAHDTHVTRMEYEARAGETERILEQVALANEGVHYLPLSDLFCDVQLCRLTNADGEPLYFDDDHISLTASQGLLPPRLKEIFEIDHN